MDPPPSISIGQRLHARLRRVEAADRLDPVAEWRTEATARGFKRFGATPILTGTWLGHALHPVLTDFADGAWMAGSFLDLFGPRGSAPAARRLIGFGLLCAVPTALTGLAEWSDTSGRDRRVGLLHGLTSSTATALYGASYLARRRDRRLTATSLAVVGGLVAIADGYVGGHLTLALGVGVKHTAFTELPHEWTPVLEADDLPEGRPVRAVAATAELVIVRTGHRVAALARRCTYRGGPLDQGTISGDTIVCPAHGCVFRLDDGAVVRGPASIPQPWLETRVAARRIEVRAVRPPDRPGSGPTVP